MSQVRAKIQNLKKEGRIAIAVPNSNCSLGFESACDEEEEEEDDDEQTPSKKFIANGVVDVSDLVEDSRRKSTSISSSLLSSVPVDWKTPLHSHLVNLLTGKGRVEVRLPDITGGKTVEVLELPKATDAKVDKDYLPERSSFSFPYCRFLISCPLPSQSVLQAEGFTTKDMTLQTVLKIMDDKGIDLGNLKETYYIPLLMTDVRNITLERTENNSVLICYDFSSQFKAQSPLNVERRISLMF